MTLRETQAVEAAWMRLGARCRNGNTPPIFPGIPGRFIRAQSSARLSSLFAIGFSFTGRSMKAGTWSPMPVTGGPSS